MVYVDSLAEHGWLLRGRVVRSCHLFTDGQLDELHRLAAQIGLRREWFQDGRLPHYDLTGSMRERAIRAGAWPVTRRKAAELWQARREDKEQEHGRD